MEQKIIYSQIRNQFRHDTIRNWETKNPTLLEGEAGVVTGLNEVGDGLEDKTKKIKFGDGIHDWNSLDWWYGSDEVDQTYNPESENAQSGIATAEAVRVANDYTDKAIKSSKTYANNTFAPAIKNTVSGSVLAVHDVSPVEHDLNIKLSSDTLTDFSNVGVSRLGKNLWTNSKRNWGNNFTVTFEDSNNIIATVNGNSIIPIFEWNFYDYRSWGNSITVSFDYEFVNSADDVARPNEFMCVGRKDRTNTFLGINKLGNDTAKKQTFSRSYTIDTDADYDYIRFAFYGSVVQGDFENYQVTLTNIQLELGSTATDYEPYIEPQTVTANADGTVDGLTSLSPDMTVMTDTEGVVIDMTYNADTKMYIDNKLAEISTAIVNNV